MYLDELEERLDKAIDRGDISEAEARNIFIDAQQSLPDFYR